MALNIIHYGRLGLAVMKFKLGEVMYAFTASLATCGTMQPLHHTLFQIGSPATIATLVFASNAISAVATQGRLVRSFQD